MIKLSDAMATDVLPPVLSAQAWAQAYAWALHRQTRRLLALCDTLAIWSAPEKLTAQMCDVLALELRTPQYDAGLPLATKRALIRNTLGYYMMAGTKGAITRITSDVFGNADVQEWFEYDGEPGYFKVTTDDPGVSDANVDEFKRVAESVKRLSAHLEKVELTLTAEMLWQYVGAAAHIATYHTIPMEGAQQ